MTEKLTYPRKLALESPQTLATVVHAIMLDQYGEPVYDWDPVTCQMEVAADFKAEICPQAIDRWCAMQVVMGSDAFFKRIDAFLNVCNTFASGAPSFEVFDPVTTEEAAWTIAEVAMNRDMLPFSYTIQRYLRLRLEQDGYDVDAAGGVPGVFAEVFADRPSEARIRAGLAAENNRTALDRYVLAQLLDMDVQFNRIPDLRRIDDLLKDDGTGLADALDAADDADDAEDTEDPDGHGAAVSARTL